MSDIDRRRLLGGTAMLGGIVTAVPGVAEANQVMGYADTAGEEVAPGVREIFLARQDVALAAYRILWMTDLVFRPGASTPADTVANDMVVLLQQGLLRVNLDEQEFVLCDDGVWAFPKGAKLACRNTGADVAVIRVIDLLPGFQPAAPAARQPTGPGPAPGRRTPAG